MASNAAKVHKLRSELEARFGRAILPSAAPPPERLDGFRTGIAAIDRLLPGGIQRGTLCLWTGDATAGRTAALRALVLHSCAEGATVALIDASLTLDATFGCTPAGPLEGLWVVRPPDASHAAEGPWAAESLLRAGVFDLVILDGCTPDAPQAHRLRTLARERDAGVVVTATRPSPSGYQLSAISYQSTEDWRLTTEDFQPAHALTHSRTHALGFRADVRLEFRRGGRTAGEGLMPGGRFRSRARVVLAKQGTSAPGVGEREVEVVHEPADCLRSHTPAPDRSPGGR